MSAATFLGLPSAGPGGARIAVLGAPHGTSYRPGERSHAAGAPAALRRAVADQADAVHHHDFDLGGPLLPPGVRAVDLGDLAGDPADPAGNRTRITGAVGAVLAVGAVPVVIGGDDSVVIPLLQAYADQGPLTVVQIDAHLDWRDEVGGERLGYSSPMRRASEMPWVAGMVQIGLRGVGSAREAEVADATAWGSRLVTARELRRHGAERAVASIPEGAACFVTLDCDALDPAVMPAVMAPAPGGLDYPELIELLHALAQRVRIIGFDLVEFAPDRDPHGLAALTASRILRSVIGMIARSA